jgi:thymidine phosphorylase
VLDVKTGSGAFMQSMENSRALAESLVEVANGAGLDTSALITDMNEPLASAAGNAVEVLNAVEFLTGARRDPRLYEVTIALAAELLMVGKLADNEARARSRIEEAFSSGRAAEIFGRMVAALGGPADFVERAATYLPAAPVVREVKAERAGFVAAIDARAIGVAVVELGGGRRRAEDSIDHAVGFTRLAAIGDAVGPDAPLGVVHARSEDAADHAAAWLREAYRMSDTRHAAPPPVHGRIGM